MSGLERIKEEFKEILSNPENGVTVGLRDDDYTKWKVTFSGPKDTVYRGGLFELYIDFPNNYPDMHPEAYFVTPIYHLNVNPRAQKDSEDAPLGKVFSNIIAWWNPKNRIKELLIEINSFFYKTNPDTAFGIERAKEYMENKAIYYEKGNYFTRKYANPNNLVKIDPNKDWDFTL